VTVETSRTILPSATGFAARQAIAFLRIRGIPLASLLNRAGVSESDLDNGRRRIAALAQGRLLEHAAEALNDSEFGLHLAQMVNPREAGLLFYVSSAAEDIEEALALAARYCRIVNEAVRPRLIRSLDGMRIEIKFVGVPRHFAWQNTEFIVAAMIKGLREMAGHDFRPTQVAFTLAREPDSGEFERFFGCPVKFSGSADQFSLSNETLAIPLVTRDDHLLETLRPVCDEAAKERNTTYGTLRSSVENEVQKLLPHGKANRQRIAKALGLTERMLAQKLAEENTSYEKVVDRLRQSLALQYMKAPGVSVPQIAWLLGYEGPTSFNHAFSRWTGKSASEARSDNQGASDVPMSKLGSAP
jgi:AraC-like DNA-binding protein